MLAPFSNYPVNEAFDRMMAEELAARADRPQEGLWARILDVLFGASRPEPAQA